MLYHDLLDCCNRFLATVVIVDTTWSTQPSPVDKLEKEVVSLASGGHIFAAFKTEKELRKRKLSANK